MDTGLVAVAPCDIPRNEDANSTDEEGIGIGRMDEEESGIETRAVAAVLGDRRS
jgi:hypothetical protein